MGNYANTCNTLREEDQILKGYSPYSEYDDKRFGEISIYTGNDDANEYVWVKKLTIETEKSYNYLIRYLRSKKYLYPKFITKQSYFLGLDGNVCGAKCMNNWKMVVIMDFVQRNLETEISKRAQDSVRTSLDNSSEIISEEINRNI